MYNSHSYVLVTALLPGLYWALDDVVIPASWMLQRSRTDNKQVTGINSSSRILSSFGYKLETALSVFPVTAFNLVHTISYLLVNAWQIL